ncbi:alpha/beta hydrolase [Paenibacillus sp. JNUCC31]|uniref:alpha/beta fold hydrolase n=1 Tax=Paenibacillus sp. JNUCC-31 TaxID=2777983 RepID=UPI00177C9C58|nr:alpha/beta hydrolase [Paenibacillus sp. JNUCC-31]QOS79764.1 alpha/beta hydrolase [Paenibacillus sp. JNUCC-31]
MDTSIQSKHKRKFGVLKFTLGLFCTVLLIIGGGFLYEWYASSQAKSEFPPAGKLVEAGGYKLHIHKQGNGSPTIIMEAGSGETSLSWRDIPSELAKHATVVTYDRAGYAWSEAAPTERTGANIVQELHLALENEGINGPYVMVGHSLGGMYARLFTQMYSNEVQGLVLIDARPEDDDRNTKALLQQDHFIGNPPASLLSLLKLSGSFRLFPDFMLEGLVAEQDRDAFINVIATPSFFHAKEEEGALAFTTEDAIRGQNLGSIPIRIIARGLPQNYAQAGISTEVGQQLESIWQTGQRNMMNLSSDSEFIIAKQSGHMVIHDEPELVVQTILELISSRK